MVLVYAINFVHLVSIDGIVRHLGKLSIHCYRNFLFTGTLSHLTLGLRLILSCIILKQPIYGRLSDKSQYLRVLQIRYNSWV